MWAGTGAGVGSIGAGGGADTAGEAARVEIRLDDDPARVGTPAGYAAVAKSLQAAAPARRGRCTGDGRLLSRVRC